MMMMSLSLITILVLLSVSTSVGVVLLLLPRVEYPIRLDYRYYHYYFHHHHLYHHHHQWISVFGLSYSKAKFSADTRVPAGINIISILTTTTTTSNYRHHHHHHHHHHHYHHYYKGYELRSMLFVPIQVEESLPQLNLTSPEKRTTASI